MRLVGDELPPWKGLVFPRRTLTLPSVPHDAGTFTTLLVGNEQDRFRRPYGLDRGKRNRSPANPSQSKERTLHIQLDTLNATEWLAISSDCGKPLTPFEPVLSHGGSAPKTRSSTCLDAWSPGFEPRGGHRTDCLRFGKQASCDPRRDRDTIAATMNDSADAIISGRSSGGTRHPCAARAEALRDGPHIRASLEFNVLRPL